MEHIMEEQLNMIWTGSSTIGKRTDVTYGNKFKAQAFSGIECHIFTLLP